MLPPAPPAWRRAFDTIERAVGEPLEQGLTSSEFARGVGIARKLRRGVARRADAAASWALHRVALPSHRDVRRMERQLMNLERQIGALQRELDRPRRDRPQDGRDP